MPFSATADACAMPRFSQVASKEVPTAFSGKSDPHVAVRGHQASDHGAAQSPGSPASVVSRSQDVPILLRGACNNRDMTASTRSPADKLQRLFELAATQAGYFTAAQARGLGYSPPKDPNVLALTGKPRSESLARRLFTCTRICLPELRGSACMQIRSYPSLFGGAL